MEDLMLIVPILVFLILLWFLYLIVNYVVTIIRTKRKDKTMVCGLNVQGKIFYAVISLIYIGVFISMIYLMITGYLDQGFDGVYLPLNILTITSIAYNYLLQFIIYFGQRQILIGRIIFDYRKIKRVTYPKATKLRFAYGQRTLETNIRMIDDSLLKKSLQRTR
ncbi:hypothetical protein H6A03_08670 [[Clostridium] spiroforme]|nr:hypothetical protein [Thomasclavelia spiroformis]MBM6880738.1 hypothetical protein [Thomasclavelia spiroformis]